MAFTFRARRPPLQALQALRQEPRREEEKHDDDDLQPRKRRNPFSRASSLDSGIPQNSPAPLAKPFRLPSFAQSTDRVMTLTVTNSAPPVWDQELEPEPNPELEPEPNPELEQAGTSDGNTTERPVPVLLRQLLSSTRMSLQQTGLVKKKASNPQKEAGDEMQVAADMDEDIIFEKLLTPSMPLLSSMHKSQASQATFGSSQANSTDWTVFNEATFTSAAKSFSWLKFSHTVESSRAVADFTSHSFPSLLPDNDMISQSSAVCNAQQGLMYWSCGGVPIKDDDLKSSRQQGKQTNHKRRRTDSSSTSSSAASGSVVEDQLEQSPCLQEWRKALSSVYFMLRHGLCDYFYVRCATFTALFVASRNGAGGCQAVITRSNKGLRASLTDKGIPFSMPLAETLQQSVHSQQRDDDENADPQPATLVDPGIDEDDVDLKDDIAKGLKVSKEAIDNFKQRRVDYKLHNSPESAIYMDTPTGMHGLFNMLYTMPIERHLPEILATAPFVNGTLRTLQIVRNRALQVAKPGSKDFETMHEIMIKGPILPSCLRTLQRVFASEAMDTTVVRKADPSDIVPLAIRIDGKV